MQFGDEVSASSSDQQQLQHTYMNAFKHMMLAPLWMNSMQPHGTPGWQANWDGHPHAPLSRTLGKSAAGEGDMPVSGTANFTAALEWFKPRYDAYKANPNNTISAADVLAAWPGFFSGSSRSAVHQVTGGSVDKRAVSTMGSSVTTTATAVAASGIMGHCGSTSSNACQAGPA